MKLAIFQVLCYNNYMKIKIPVPKPIKMLSERLNKPLYLVGGYVRDYILYGKISHDVDFCAPIPPETIEKEAIFIGFKVVAVYKKTGTVKLKFNENEFEYTAFRTEKYKKGGFHSPEEIIFTSDIGLDATRRDFKCNAIYYDVKSDALVDLLGGIDNLKNGVLDTVVSPEKVFSCDGLRLIRLARFSSKHNLFPTKEVFLTARKYKNLILDVTPDRIKDELIKILSADGDTCERGLEILIKTGVLGVIFNNDGRRKNETSFSKIVSAIPVNLRLFVLSFLYKKEVLGTIERLEFLRISKAEIKNFYLPLRLLAEFFSRAKTDKEIRRIVLDNFTGYDNFYEIAVKIALKNKKFVLRLKKWATHREKIINDGVPITVSDLKITAKELITLGVNPKNIKMAQAYLLSICQKRPSTNQKSKLIKLAKEFINAPKI